MSGGSSMLAVMSRGFAAVGIASALVFAVPITSEALVNPVPLGQFVVGAVRSAAPAIAGSEILGPEAALLVGGAVVLGAAAYYTRDTWMPWLSGNFGAGGTVNGSGDVGGQYTMSVAVDPAAGGVWSVTATIAGGVDFVATAETVNWQCKTSGGVITASAPVNIITTLAKTQYGGPVSATVSGQCPSLGTVVSVATSRYNTGLHYPANQVSWGAPFDSHGAATYNVNVTCRKTDGTTAVITAVTTNPGSPAAGSEVPGPGGGGILVPSCDAAFAGSHGEGIAFTGAPTGGVQQPLASQTWGSTSTLYPNCVGAGNACSYVVTYLGAPCVIGQAECVAWAVRAQARPQDYGCLFGAYVMSLAACSMDERVYEPNGVVLTGLNTDGNPNTYDAPVPAWAPQPAPSPVAGAPGGAPAPVPGPQGQPTGTQTNNSDCWPSGLAAWNPAEWVLQPIKCALSWAFVPSAATLTGVTDGVAADVARIGLPALGAAVLPLFSVPSGSGCAGPEVVLPLSGYTFTSYPFSACAEPLATAAWMTHALFTVVIVVGGGLGLLRLIGAGFGFNVGFRGSGGDGS